MRGSASSQRRTWSACHLCVSDSKLRASLSSLLVSAISCAHSATYTAQRPAPPPPSAAAAATATPNFFLLPSRYSSCGLAIRSHPVQIPADKLPQHQLLDLQKIMKGELGNADSIVKASKIYETVGVYLGYATAQYLEFYEFSFFLILGRLTKGAGGDIVIEMAQKVRPLFTMLALERSPVCHVCAPCVCKIRLAVVCCGVRPTQFDGSRTAAYIDGS